MSGKKQNGKVVERLFGLRRGKLVGITIEARSELSENQPLGISRGGSF